MSRRAYKTSIPTDAVEVIESSYPNGTRRSAAYFLGSQKVGFREWSESGRLEFETGMRGGVRHGHEYRFYPSGRLLEKETYRGGLLHGVGRQWAEDGRLLVKWKFVQGVGLDLWCDPSSGRLAEEHYWPGPEELGYTRMWNGDERTVWQEYFHAVVRGYHGVWREWGAEGKLRRGFPRYFIDDVRVPREEYLRACERDLLLPRYSPEDDSPCRRLPEEYLFQRKKRKG
jgi:hypothetical protein